MSMFKGKKYSSFLLGKISTYYYVRDESMSDEGSKKHHTRRSLVRSKASSKSLSNSW